MPLLYVKELAIRWGLEVDMRLNQRIAKAIEAIVRKQAYDGTFGLWYPFDRTEPWLSAYVMDFLVRAKAMGHLVPDDAYERGLHALASMVEEDLPGPGKALDGIAYAHYVLTLAGRPRSELCRYLFKERQGSITSPLALAHLGAALAMQGDVQTGGSALSQALAMPPNPLSRRVMVLNCVILLPY